MISLEENNDLKSCLITMKKSLSLGKNLVILQG